jgi:hypothetical protein
MKIFSSSQRTKGFISSTRSDESSFRKYARTSVVSGASGVPRLISKTAVFELLYSALELLVCKSVYLFNL